MAPDQCFTFVRLLLPIENLQRLSSPSGCAKLGNLVVDADGGNLCPSVPNSIWLLDIEQQHGGKRWMPQ